MADVEVIEIDDTPGEEAASCAKPNTTKEVIEPIIIDDEKPPDDVKDITLNLPISKLDLDDLISSIVTDMTPGIVEEMNKKHLPALQELVPKLDREYENYLYFHIISLC